MDQQQQPTDYSCTAGERGCSASQALRAVVDGKGADVGARELARGAVELLPGAARTRIAPFGADRRASFDRQT